MSIGPPPVDGHGKLKSRRLAAGTVWYRIGHRRYGTALHFSTGDAARWNDSLDTYGVLYVADAPETAFAETFGHDVPESYPPGTDKFVTVTELTERHLYRISTGAELHLGLLQGAGLAALNLDVRLLASVDYPSCAKSPVVQGGEDVNEHLLSSHCWLCWARSPWRRPSLMRGWYDGTALAIAHKVLMADMQR